MPPFPRSVRGSRERPLRCALDAMSPASSLQGKSWTATHACFTVNPSTLFLLGDRCSEDATLLSHPHCRSSVHTLPCWRSAARRGRTRPPQDDAGLRTVPEDQRQNRRLLQVGRSRGLLEER